MQEASQSYFHSFGVIKCTTLTAKKPASNRSATAPSTLVGSPDTSQPNHGVIKYASKSANPTPKNLNTTKVMAYLSNVTETASPSLPTSQFRLPRQIRKSIAIYPLTTRPHKAITRPSKEFRRV